MVEGIKLGNFVDFFYMTVGMDRRCYRRIWESDMTVGITIIFL
jgi:hypothetical protein